jgi:hypothetical protein
VPRADAEQVRCAGAAPAGDDGDQGQPGGDHHERVHQRGIVDNLAGLRQAGVMPTPKQ